MSKYAHLMAETLKYSKGNMVQYAPMTDQQPIKDTKCWAKLLEKQKELNYTKYILEFVCCHIRALVEPISFLPCALLAAKYARHMNVLVLLVE